ncbi:MAG TPA: 16S rRNA (uracil(1498)-N(3))-methyltransferase [Candidatus Baltobacteraceae bacterium]|jgi:16S rRNA (uracil1498-N3)-methyltransferase|nr:16S rRNA (uracil(1498)-N(3))-methyltransferase [Candidatus Baltobacteraceae bacterium]
MPARRFFIEGLHADGDAVVIGGEDAHKIVRVLRLKNGDMIELVDSGATLFEADVSIDGDRVTARVRNARRAVEKGPLIDVAQAVPKGHKMDFVVEKLTELGVAAILPFESERCVVRDVRDAKVDRWRRLAQAAAQQSGRIDIPPVRDVIPYDALLERFSEYEVVLFPWEVAEARALRETLPTLVANAGRILVVIGPEGGFSHEEALRAQGASATIISLGALILRTETAALFVVSVLRYLL